MYGDHDTVYEFRLQLFLYCNSYKGDNGMPVGIIQKYVGITVQHVH